MENSDISLIEPGKPGGVSEEEEDRIRCVSSYIKDTMWRSEPDQNTRARRWFRAVVNSHYQLSK